MEYRPLGTSGIDVSVIGFGCGGNAGLMVSGDEALRMATVRRAVDAGIDYFDTAPAYGDGRSEVNLGRALRALGVAPVVSTKVVLQSADRGDPRGAVLRSVEHSFGRLGVDHVDVLILHNRVFDHADVGDFGIGAKLGLGDVLGPKGVAAGLEELRSAGAIKISGFTALGGDISAITALIDSGCFGALNVSLNLLNPSAAVRVPPSFSEPKYAEIVTRADAAGMGVMAIQVLARGALTGTGPPSGRTARVAGTALAHDVSLARIATRYVLGKRGVSTAILGLSRLEHVDEAVAAAAAGRLPAAVEHAIESVALAS
jgi:aryl-alcohol dehydrogenase-like predicted oxidoreductase